MSKSQPVMFEQVALELLVENSRTNFRRALQSTKAKILLLGSFDGQNDVVNDYIKLKRPGIDLRKKLSKEDGNLRDALTSFLRDAKIYSRWIRKHSFNPIWDEALISYCGAFETCLKSIAMAFYIGREQINGLKYEVFIPGDEITKARRFIAREWSREVDDLPRCQYFYDRLVSSSPCVAEFPELLPVPKETWDVCSAAFQVRNFIVHNLSIVSSTLELGNTTFHAGSRVEFGFSHLRLIEKAFESVLSPFSNDILDVLDDESESS